MSRRNVNMIFCALAMLATGCASNQKMIISDPPEASVSINGQLVGITPLKYNFDFNARSKYEISITKDGYIAVDRLLYSETPMASQSELHYNLERDPAWDDTSESPFTNQWQQISISPDYNKQTMWPLLVQTVTEHYSGIQVMDAQSCYISSLPRVKSYTSSSGAQCYLRTYMIGSIFTSSPLIYQVKIVAERSDGGDNWVPWQRVYRQDKELVEEIQQRLGIK